MFTMIGEEVFRQRISALSKDEVSIACDILVAMHPAQYFNALSRRYMTILKDNETVGGLFKERYHEYQRLIGNESQIVNIPKPLISETRDSSEDSVLNQIHSVSTNGGFNEEILTDDDIELTNITNTEDIKIPNFLGD